MMNFMYNVVDYKFDADKDCVEIAYKDSNLLKIECEGVGVKLWTIEQFFDKVIIGC
jgi:hypothetical protein